jgi:adenylylsulfate kinase
MKMKTEGFVVWLTGYSCSGKTTISAALEEELRKCKIPCERLDGDVIRENLSKGLSFSKEDRDINVMRIGFVAELLARHGVGVIVSAISPYRSARDQIRQKVRNFIEVFVQCSLHECERRDIKGLYAKARKGDIKSFTGVDDPYEEPLNPEIICNTESETVDDSVYSILLYLENILNIRALFHFPTSGI